MKDPAVKETLSLFGGEVLDIRKEAPPAEPSQENEETDADNEGNMTQ